MSIRTRSGLVASARSRHASLASSPPGAFTRSSTVPRAARSPRGTRCVARTAVHQEPCFRRYPQANIAHNEESTGGSLHLNRRQMPPSPGFLIPIGPVASGRVRSVDPPSRSIPQRGNWFPDGDAGHRPISRDAKYSDTIAEAEGPDVGVEWQLCGNCVTFVGGLCGERARPAAPTVPTWQPVSPDGQGQRKGACLLGCPPPSTTYDQCTAKVRSPV